MKKRLNRPVPVILTFLAIVGASFLPLFSLIGNGAFLICSLCPFAVGWLLGMRKGLLYWLFHSILLFFLAPLAGSSIEDLKSSGLPMYAVTFLFTGAIGKISDLYASLLDELEKRRTVEKKLAGYQQKLETLVEERTAELLRVNEQLKQEMMAREQANLEKLKLEVSLKRAEKMEALGILAGGVAHDLNNILGGIMTYPELLLLDIPDNSPLREPILTIKKSGERAAAVVQDLLALARRGIFNTGVLDLNQMIREVLHSPEYTSLKEGYPGVTLTTELKADLLNTKGSSVHLSKAVMNLISNAMEAVKGGGEITISTDNVYVDRTEGRYEILTEGDYVSVRISDTGEGIPTEDLGYIFEPFYTKKVMGKSGTGLGLAIVWGTVKDHNGFVDVQSAVGKGTVFHLYFPATREAESTAGAPLDLKDLRGKGESILVIDDVAVQRTLAVSILTKLGYTVTSVSGGEEAVAYLRENSADLLVLDMIMKDGLNGLETYRKILDIHPGQNCIIVSGYAETELVRQTQALGAGAYVRKPFTFEKLGTAVKNALAGSGQDPGPGQTPQ